MIPTGLRMSDRTTFGDGGTETAHSLDFTLHLAGHDSLRLETGEVFENPAYAAVHGNKKNEILARMNVRPMPNADDELYGSRMTYHEGSSGNDYAFPPCIYFYVSTPSSDYSLLLNNIRAGITPSSVMVELQADALDKAGPLTYDWAPDGSMMIWRNTSQQNRVVMVKSIEFHYRLLGEADHDEEDKQPAAKVAIGAASTATVGKLTEWENAFVKTISWIVPLTLLTCAVWYFGRH
jgi:hypothetical protein